MSFKSLWKWWLKQSEQLSEEEIVQCDNNYDNFGKSIIPGVIINETGEIIEVNNAINIELNYESLYGKNLLQFM